MKKIFLFLVGFFFIFPYTFFAYGQSGSATLSPCISNCSNGVVLFGATEGSFQPPVNSNPRMQITQLKITYSVQMNITSPFTYNIKNWGIGFASPPTGTPATSAIYYGSQSPATDGTKITINDSNFNSTTRSGSIVVTLDFTGASSKLPANIGGLVANGGLLLQPFYLDGTNNRTCTTGCFFFWQADVGAIKNPPAITVQAAEGAFVVNLTPPSDLSAVAPNNLPSGTPAATQLTGTDYRTSLPLVNSISGYVIIYWLDQYANGTFTGCRTSQSLWNFYLNPVALANPSSTFSPTCAYTSYQASYRIGGTTPYFGCGASVDNINLLPVGSATTYTLTDDLAAVPFVQNFNPTQLAQGSDGTPVGCYYVVYVPSSQSSWSKANVNNGDVYGVSVWALNYAMTNNNTVLFPNYSLAHSNISYITGVNLSLGSTAKNSALALQKSDCFVVTSASGNPGSESVFYWRILRDEYLTPAGFTPFYYKHAQVWAGWLDKHPALKPPLNYIFDITGKYLYRSTRFMKKTYKNIMEVFFEVQKSILNLWEKSANAQETSDPPALEAPASLQIPSYELYVTGGVLIPTADSVYYDAYYFSQPTGGFTGGANYLYWLQNFGFSAGLLGRYLTNKQQSSVNTLETEQSYTRSIYILSTELVTGIRYSNKMFPYIQPGIFLGAGGVRLREEAVVGANQPTYAQLTSVKGVTQYSFVYEFGVNIDVSLFSIVNVSQAERGSLLNDVLFRFAGSYNLNPSQALSSTGYLVGAGFSFLLN